MFGLLFRRTERDYVLLIGLRLPMVVNLLFDTGGGTNMVGSASFGERRVTSIAFTARLATHLSCLEHSKVVLTLFKIL